MDNRTDSDQSYASTGFGGDRPIGVLVIADGGDSGAAGDAAAHVGGRVIDVIGWDDAVARLGDHALFDVIVVEAEGVDDDRLEAVLPRVDTLARASDASVVVALDGGQIDIVAAHLLGPRVQLLCAPTLTDRVVALGLVPGAAARLNDRLHEGERERLRRLNDEVARIAQTLVRLTDRDDLLPTIERAGIVGDQRGGYRPGPIDETPAIEPQSVRNAIRSRRLRDQFFPSTLLEDPGWDMLLDLFAAELEGRPVSVSSLCIAAAVAQTTALRWIGKMTDAELFQRRPDPFDRRRAFVTLTETARRGMQHYCHAVRQAGLAIA